MSIRLLAIDETKEIYISFNTGIQSVVERFMEKFGYNNTDYRLCEDTPKIISQLSDDGFTETEVIVWESVDYTNNKVYVYWII